MVAPSISDLRYAFFGGGTDLTMTDAEYQQLLALYNAGGEGVTLPGLVSGQAIADLRTGDPADWVRWIFTPDTANAPDSKITFNHGQAVIEVVGGSGVQSNRREGWQIPGVPACEFSRIKSLWSSRPPADGLLEHAHMHRLQLGADGKHRAIVCWDFGFGVMLVGIWEAFPDGTGANFPQAPLRDSEAVTASARAGNVVTLTVAAGANNRWRTGDGIVVDLADATFDMTTTVLAVTNTTITYAQTAIDDADGGVGSVTLVGAPINYGISRNYALTDAVRTAGVVTSVGLIVNHGLAPGDWVKVDMTDVTYDMPRALITSANLFTAQVSWLQPGVADDPAAGTGQLMKATPYWVETELLPGNIFRVRIAPDIGGGGIGLTATQGTGNLPNNVGTWEDGFAATYDMNRAVGATLPTGDGVVALGAAHHSSVSEVRYAGVSASPLYYTA